MSLAGCPTGSDDTSDDPPLPPTELTAEQIQAVNAAFAQFVAGNRVLISLRGLIAGIDAIEKGAAPPAATCPTISVTTAGDAANVLLDFTDVGCVDPLLGDTTRAGVIRYGTIPAANNGDVTFEGFQIAGESVTGTANLSWLDRAADQITLSGTLDFTTAAGNLHGIVTMQLRDTGLLTFTNGFWQLSTLGTDLQLREPGNNGPDLIIDPTDNPDLLPYTGIIAFDTAADGRLEIIFNAETPTTRTVTVRVDKTHDFPYQIP